jgi:transposase
MPPKKKTPKCFPWAKGRGKLEPFGEGVIFGMHYAKVRAAEIAALMGVTKATIYDVVGDLQRRLGDVGCAGDASEEPAETEESAEEDLAPTSKFVTPDKLAEIEERRSEVQRLMSERDEKGRHSFNSSREIGRHLRGVVCARTIRRDLAALGMAWKSRPKTAFMTDDHRRRRIEAAAELLEFDENDILFSDESLFDCSDMQLKAWQRPGEPMEPRRVERWTAKVHVWGVIGVGFRLLVILPDDRVNAESYRRTLADHLIPIIPDGKVFMQDGAPAHSAKLTREFLQESGVQTVPWPAKSPDLNPIENLWGIMKSRIRVETKADVEDLEIAIIDAWNEVSDEEIDALVKSFPHRVRRMVESKGDDATIKRCYK